MLPVWVKICGIQTMKAAVAAYEAGADALGFIFVPTRRQVSPERAQALISGLPPERAKVGLFVDQAPEVVVQIARFAGLTHVQLHGNEPAEAISAIGLPVIKAFRVKGPDDLAQLPSYREAAGILLDPFVAGQHGGTGQTLDWTLVRWAAETLTKAGVELARGDEPLTPGKPRLMLAGGLTPENVGEAVRQAAPGGVDVSSGVETNGEKDIDKIYRFVTEAKGVRV